MKLPYHTRRTVAVLLALAATVGFLIANPASYEQEFSPATSAESQIGHQSDTDAPLATEVLAKLEIKGRASKSGYTRTEFYNGWPLVDGCSLRQKILKRDFGDSAKLDQSNPCNVVAGKFIEPYTGEEKTFSTRLQIAKGVQIDHIVALSDAWQKGARGLTKEQRYRLATDPLNLISADASANMTKSDGDAATWLPKNKAFRCQYVARQISVKYKYHLWVTQAENAAMTNVLSRCPKQPAIGVKL